MLQADATLAKKSLIKMDPITGAVPPENLIPGRHVQFGKDNLDAQKESAIAGHNAGFYGTQGYYQPGPAPDLPIANIEFCKDNIVVPEAIHKVIYLNKPIVKEPPFHLSEKQVNEIFDFTSNTEGNMKFRQARAENLVFNFFRYGINRQKEKTAHWTEFNKKLYSPYKEPASVVGQQPILNAKAYEYDTINANIEHAKVITKLVGDEHAWFVADQDIYAPAQETIWTRGDKNVHFRLGRLHTSNIYMACIGDHITDSEIPLFWTQAEMLTAGEADKILQGRDYKAGLRTHRITWQAAWRLIIPQFIVYLEENHKDINTDITALSQVENSVEPLLTRVDTLEFFKILEEFLTMKKRDKNFKFIWTYMEKVQVLLAFTTAQHADEFKLHINAFTRMLGSFLRYLSICY